MMMILNLSSVAVLWFGGRLVSEGSMPIGNLTAFLTYILQILLSVMMAVIGRHLAAARSGQRRARRAGARHRAGRRRPRASNQPTLRSGLVSFEHVTFLLPRQRGPVLEDLTFTLEPGQTSAIIGGTGSGKTTLLNLIPRFFDARAAPSSVNGVDVRDQRQETLLGFDRIGTTGGLPLHGHRWFQLALRRPDATDEQLWRALEIAQASDFVSAMSACSRHRSTRAAPTSRGPAQRLSIARALVKAPSVYLFDDCFSALDAATDARLRAALKSGTQDASVVIVAQRVSTIMHAERIIVLDDGRSWVWLAQRASRELRAVPRDRRLPARRGRRDMSMGPMGAMRGGGVPPQKSKDLRATLHRLLERLRPERTKLAMAIGLGVTSVAFMVSGPEILGNATNVLFDGLIGARLKPGTTKAQAIAMLRREGHSQIASMIGG